MSEPCGLPKETRRGRKTSPPEAMAAVAVATCRGVARTVPWPMEIWAVSAGVHLLWLRETRSLQCSQNHEPSAS